MQTDRFIMLIIIVALLGVGIITIYNSSGVQIGEKEEMGDGGYFLKKQLMWLCLGIIAFVISSYLNYNFIIMHAPAILLFSLFLLALVFVPGIGVEINNARRWIQIGGKIFQPSEFAKYAIIFYMAYYLSKKQRKLDRFFDTFVPLLFVVALYAGLIIVQPDFSTTIVIGAIAFILFYAGGAKLHHLLIASAASFPPLIYKIYHSEYQLYRIIAFLNPGQYKSGIGYQQYQSLIALGSGGLYGLGLAGSKQKLGFLPYPHNDFIASIIGEEFGFIGICSIILLYMALALIGFRIAFRAKDMRARLLAVGITSLISLQAIIHISVVTSSLPATGLNLPFISFGGSNLLMNFIGIGILMNISKAAERSPQAKAQALIKHRKAVIT